MATTNIETIVDALSTALETITPDARPTSRFKRWKGGGLVEKASTPLRERAFQFRLGASKTPRRLSSLTIQWQRCELQLIVGYNLDEPQQGDALGLGLHRLPMSDAKQIVNKLYLSNALSGVSNVLRLQYGGADSPGEASRVYRFDLEWGETFTL